MLCWCMWHGRSTVDGAHEVGYLVEFLDIEKKMPSAVFCNGIGVCRERPHAFAGSTWPLTAGRS